MAFDFDTRNPADPKSVKRIVPYATKIYLPAAENDWSDFTTDPSAASQRGLKREVDASIVILNDGTQYYAVQDARGRPIDVIGDQLAPDTETARAWAQQQTQTQRQEQPRGAADQRTAREEAEIARNAALPPEQDPRSETDAQRAARADARIKEQGAAAAAAQKPVGPKGELREIGGRLKEFDPSTGDFTIDHGATTKTADGTATVETDVKDRPGWKQITTKTVQGGSSVEGTYYRAPDGQIHASLPGQETSAEESGAIEGAPGWRVIKRARKDANGNTVAETVYRDPQGQEHPSPPPTGPKYSEVKFDPETRKWHGLKKDGSGWEELPPGGPGTSPASANQGPRLPQIVLGQSQDALRSYRDDLTRQVGAGLITPAVADQRWKEAADIANYAIREAQTVFGEEQNRRSADVSLRTNAMSNSMSGFNSALDFVGRLNPTLKIGSTKGAEALVAILGMQQMQAERMGAFRNEFSGAQAPRGYAVPGGISPAGAGSSGPSFSQAEVRPPMDTGPDAGRSPVATPNGGASTGNYVNPALLEQTPQNVIGAGSVPDSITPSAPTVVNQTGSLFDPGFAPPAPDQPPISMAQDGEQFAALQPFTPPIAPQIAPGDGGGGDFEALRAAQIASTPPWRLSDDDMEWAQSRGLLGHAMRIPGMGMTV